MKETKVAGQENDDLTGISISLLAKLRVTSMQSGYSCRAVGTRGVGGNSPSDFGMFRSKTIADVKNNNVAC